MSTTRPNILLITTDQQRGDCLGIDPQAPTALQNNSAVQAVGSPWLF